MPRSKPTSGKRKPAGSAACEPDPIFEIAKRIYLPQIEAAGLLDALVLMGHGMTELGRDDAGAVLTIAQAARQRLHLIDEGCIDLMQAARRG